MPTPTLPLPYELIVEIFRSLVGSHEIHDPTIHLSLSAIAAVSRLWRSLALSSPDLWHAVDWLSSDRDCNPSTPQNVQQRNAAYIQRSQSSPLDVRFHHGTESGSDEGQLAQWEMFYAAIKPHQNRIRAYDIQLFFRNVSSIHAILPLKGSFHRAQSLRVSVSAARNVVSDFEGETSEVLMEDSSAIQPRALFFHVPFHQVLPNICPSQLRVFQTNLVALGTNRNVSSLINNSHLLRHLSIKGPSNTARFLHRIRSTLSTVEFPRIESMTFLGEYSLIPLRAPNLQILSITIDGELPDAYQFTKNLPNLRFLHLMYTFWSPEHVTSIEQLLCGASNIVQLKLPQWEWTHVREVLTFMEKPKPFDPSSLIDPFQNLHFSLLPVVKSARRRVPLLPYLRLITISSDEGVTPDLARQVFSSVTKARPSVTIFFDGSWFNKPGTTSGQEHLEAIVADGRRLAKLGEVNSDIP